MNIREFAAICKVAPSTASKVLNHSFEDAQVSRKTYDRIRMKAEQIGFRRSYLARALSAQRSNCIGFIAGASIQMVCGPILDGIVSFSTRQGQFLSIYSCNNDPSQEQNAFEKLCYNQSDAIIMVPSMQPTESLNFSHLATSQENYSDHPPIVVLGECKLPGIYRIGFHDYETGRQAAIRQLALGCRNFTIIDSKLTSFASLERIRGYRETLLSDGVPPQNIREVQIWPPEQKILEAALQDTDGIWCCYYSLLVSCRHALHHSGRLGMIHADCLCSEETAIFIEALFAAPCPENELWRYPRSFASLTQYRYSLLDLGRRGAETAYELGLKKTGIPSVQYLDFERKNYGGE